MDEQEKQMILDCAARAIDALEALADNLGAVGYFSRAKDLRFTALDVRDTVKAALEHDAKEATTP